MCCMREKCCGCVRSFTLWRLKAVAFIGFESESDSEESCFFNASTMFAQLFFLMAASRLSGLVGE
jgi:hypothetical protein